VGDNTYWAVGGVISSSDLTASFYVSTDNGNSWKQDTTIDNYFAVGIGEWWWTLIWHEWWVAWRFWSRPHTPLLLLLLSSPPADCNVASSSYTCWAVLQDSNSNTWVASASS